MKKILKYKRVLQLSTLILTAGLVFSSVGCWLDIFGGVGEEPVESKPIATVIYEDNEILQNGEINAGNLLPTQTKNIIIKIENTGTELLTIGVAKIAITGTNAAAFTKLTDPSDNIPAGKQTSFIIGCQPIKEGDNSATLTIPTNDKSRNPIRAILWIASPNVYAVTFDANGGSGTVPDAQTVDIGSSITLPDTPSLSRLGYTFGGWNTNANGTGTNYSANTSYTPTSNIRLYAKWNGNTYTITFNANEGTGITASVTATYGSPMPVITTYPTKAGLYFAGYFDAATGGNKYYTSNLASARNWDKTMDATLYAQWSASLEVTIIFHSNDGTDQTRTQNVQEYASTTLRSNDFTRAGYNFAGWATTASGPIVYANGANYTVSATDVPLYAVWTLNPERSITFHSNDENNQTKTQNVPENTQTTLDANMFTRTGYTFAGWATTPTGSVIYGNGATYIMGTTNIILYAVWSAATTPSSYTITFNANGGGGVPLPVTAIYGSPMPAMTIAIAPTQTGYSFVGYFDAQTGGTIYYTASLTSARNWDKTSNATLYAQWEPVEMEMVWIEPGTFTMGEDGLYGETVHEVTLTKGFYMGKYEVTQEQYMAVMGTYPGAGTYNFTAGEVQGRRPVYGVSWYDAIVFCNKLSVMEGLTPAYRINGNTDPSDWGTVPTSSNATWNAVEVVSGSTGYRLPTEAQWEYACRAGTTTAYNTNSDTISDDTGWYSSNSSGIIHEVGLKPANVWGLYDMHGNVDEWCWDWHDWHDSYSSGSQVDPTGAVSGSERVYRSGAWHSDAPYVRSAFRMSITPSNTYLYIGLRVVRP